MYRIIVNVNNNPFKVIDIGYLFTFKRTFKKAAMASISFIEPFCIGIKQVRKKLMRLR